MDILYLLIPLSAVLVLAIIAVFGWALHHGQFDDVEREGARILDDQMENVDDNQVPADAVPEQSMPRRSQAGRSGQARVLKEDP
jgi:cbb3-type cytochrome oxidase maturation protein